VNVEAKRWRAFADSPHVAAARSRRWPGSSPLRGRAVCSCGEQLGPVTDMCAVCHFEAWTWVAAAFTECRQSRPASRGAAGSATAGAQLQLEFDAEPAP
jgi:hypothetical protein